MEFIKKIKMFRIIDKRAKAPPSQKKRSFQALYTINDFKDVIMLLSDLEYSFSIVHLDKEFILVEFNARKDFLKVVEIAGDLISGGLLYRIRYSYVSYPLELNCQDCTLFEDDYSVIKGAIKSHLDVNTLKRHLVVKVKSVFSKRNKIEIKASDTYLAALSKYLIYKSKKNEHI